MIYVNVTTADGELLGRFPVVDEDLYSYDPRYPNGQVAASIGQQVLDQLPRAMLKAIHDA